MVEVVSSPDMVLCPREILIEEDLVPKELDTTRDFLMAVDLKCQWGTQLILAAS